MILNVEPGGCRPSSPMPATARISPVEGCIATIAAELAAERASRPLPAPRARSWCAPPVRRVRGRGGEQLVARQQLAAGRPRKPCVESQLEPAGADFGVGRHPFGLERRAPHGRDRADFADDRARRFAERVAARRPACALGGLSASDLAVAREQRRAPRAASCGASASLRRRTPGNACERDHSTFGEPSIETISSVSGSVERPPQPRVARAPAPSRGRRRASVPAPRSPRRSQWRCGALRGGRRRRRRASSCCFAAGAMSPYIRGVVAVDSRRARSCRPARRRGDEPRWAPTIAPVTKATAASASTGRARRRRWWRLSGKELVEHDLVTGLDWLIVAFAAVLALFGFRQGFIVGALSFAGFVAGCVPRHPHRAAAAAARGRASPYAPAFGLVGALLGGAILATGLEGIALQAAPDARPARPRARRRRARRRCSAPALALGVVWIAAAVAAQTPGAQQLRADIQRSAILRELNAMLPPSGPILDALARLDPLPSITGPSPDVAAPSPGSPGCPGCGRPRAASCACSGRPAASRSRARAGSRRRARRHQRPRRRRRAETRRSRRAAGTSSCGRTDPLRPRRTTSRSCACRRSRLPALALASSTRLRARAARSSATRRTAPSTPSPPASGSTQPVETQNAYGQGPVTRLLTPLRGLVRPGNSGGPVVDASRPRADDGLRRDRRSGGPRRLRRRELDGRRLAERVGAGTGPEVSTGPARPARARRHAR